MLSIWEVNNRERLYQIKKRWDKMLFHSHCQAPYLSLEWYLSALETIDKDRLPLVLFFKSSGEDIGLIPLVYKKLNCLGFTYHLIGFINNACTPYQGFVYLNSFKDILTNLIRYLSRRFGTLFYLDLNEIRLTNHEYATIRELASKGLFLFDEEQKPGSRYLILDRDFDQIINTLSRHTQKEFKRKINRLAKLGFVDLIRIQGHAQIEYHLDRFFKFYARTWKGEEPHPEFYYNLCKRFESLGKLHFYGLTLDEQPIAYLICLVGKDNIYGIKTTYNPSYYAFSPGVILFYKSIENMLSIPGMREFDIGRGDEQFKREWTSLSHEHTRLCIYPNTFFWKVVNQIRYHILPFMKQQGKFNEFYSAIRSRLLHAEKFRCASNEITERTYRKITYDDYKDIAVSGNYTARLVQPFDVDRLVVAMSTRNFKEVQERIEKQQCIIILENEKILAYFWIPLKMNKRVDINADIPEIVIEDWGLAEDMVHERLEEQCISIFLKSLKDKDLLKRGVMLLLSNHRASERKSG
jgi:hypothetical protein